MAFVGRRCSRIATLLAATLLAGAMPLAVHAVTADVTVQVLDQLDVFSSARLKRSTTNPILFEDLNSSGSTGLRSCQNGRNGMTCLDGQLVRQWKAPKVLSATTTSDAGRVLFSCQDDALALSASDSCLSLTTDVGGAVWIAGRKSSTTHNLIEIQRNQTDGECPNSGKPLSGRVKNQPLANTDSKFYCAYTRRTGRPLLLDISAFDGELSARSPWPGGRGILGVENKKTVVFFPSDGGAVLELGSGKRDWSLVGNEQVLSAALLQREVAGATPTVHTHVLVTTSTGRLMWRNTASSAAAKQLADVNAAGAEGDAPSVNDTTGVVSFPRGTLCESGSTANFFEVRVSDTTGRVFATNRNYCKTLVTSPDYAGADIVSGTDNQKFSTSATFRPEGISVSPGISIDLSECATTDGCSFLPGSTDSIDPDGENDFAARMTQVTLAPNSPANMTVFQIRNLPDCRYLDAVEAPDCDVVADGVIDAADSVWVDGPRGRYLNVTPLLPQQIKDLFDTSGVAPTGLPPLYLSPRYRAQDEQDFFFEALFGVADPNVQFRGEFTLDLDVGDDNLAGDKLGCGVFDKTPGTVPEPDVFNDWDIVTVVSERFANVGGPTDVVVGADADHVDMLANKDCFNPTAGAGSRWSLYSYNLELAEDTSRDFSYDDGVVYLGELVKQLFFDLRATQQRLACANVDAVGNEPLNPAAAPPLGTSACNVLDANWVNANDKAVKCINATYDPKSSALDQNCQSFNSQWDPYYSYVQGLSPSGVDPANRVGELRARMDVIRHLFYDQFLGAVANQVAP